MKNIKRCLFLSHVRRINLIVVAVSLLMLVVFLRPYFNEIVVSEERLSLKDFPNQIGDWKGQDAAGLDIRSLDILRLTSYVTKRFTDSKGRSVYVYIGYWANQTGEYQAAKHSPALCLPSNGWQTTTLEDYVIDSNAKLSLMEPVKIRRMIGTKRASSELFHYWFFSGKKYYSQEWYALISLSISNLLYGRSDGGIVEISSPILGDSTKQSNIEAADSTLRDFSSELFPFLHSKIQ